MKQQRLQEYRGTFPELQSQSMAKSKEDSEKYQEIIIFNFLHHNISMHILQTVLYTFLEVCVRR